jgi:hypothetical protein
MTSMATIVAAIPPALAIGPGAEVRIPMAITVIGGVIVSTLLTLFVVPCIYLVFTKIERKKYTIAPALADLIDPAQVMNFSPQETESPKS